MRSVDAQRSAAELVAVQVANGRLGHVDVRELGEPEALRIARLAVIDDPIYILKFIKKIFHYNILYL